MKIITFITIIIIITLAAFFRLYGLNWDSSFHLHPDERMITMVADKITFQNLNPYFFAYGSFPIYLLKATGFFAGIFDPQFSTYQSINLLGRFLSALFDLGTIIILYFLGKKLFDKNIGLLAALFYSLAVLPIQLAHFYAVDTILTFFILSTLYLLIRFLDNPTFKNILLIGISFGLALSTKISAILLIVPIIIAFIITLSLLVKSVVLDPPIGGSQASLIAINLSKINKLFILLFLFLSSTIITFLLFEPFALLDFQNFWRQTLEQQQMTKSAFAFPYTLQYVGKIPYLYELQNIFFWGLGPILASLAFIGTLFFTYKTFRKPFDSRLLTLVTFFWLYFLVVGHFAIGFMRYTLPLYPLLCLFAAFFVQKLFDFLYSHFKNYKPLLLTTYYLLLITLLIWPLFFISIYSQPNTRIQASEWIFQNIPAGKTLAREHWDDGLPLAKQNQYKILELPLYDSDDNPLKWIKINQVLKNTDYIIIASNRLYTPLQKLTNCPNLPSGKCYKKAANYYQQLFSGELGFKKVAEFSVYPSLTIDDERLTINDFTADESFTVYDHPKIMIFQKNEINNEN